MKAVPPFLTALMIAFAVPAAAQSSDIVIKTEDLDLSSEAGRATLERRIVSAERQACMAATATGSRSRAAQEQKACRADVRRQIEARMPSAQ